MTKAKEIRELLRQITGADNKPAVLFNAEVTAVQAEVCTVKYAELELEDVRLSAVVDGNTKNLVIKPTVGSMVLVADLSLGELRDLVLMGWTEIDSISINGGENEGLVKVAELTNKLNTIEDSLNALKTVFSGWVPVPSDGGAVLKTAVTSWATQRLTKSDKAALQNDKIKH